MRKIISIIMAVSMLICMLAVPALAENTAVIDVKASAAKVSVGDTITYTVVIPAAMDDYRGLQFTFNYDSTVLEYVSSTRLDPTGRLGNVSFKGDGKLEFLSAAISEDQYIVAANTEMMSVTFTVLSADPIVITLDPIAFGTMAGEATVEPNIDTVTQDHTHDWGEWITDTEATCTTDGSMHRVCSSCGETETEVIPAGHTWGEWITDTEATCTTDGSMHRVCSVCGETETDIITAPGHTDINGDKLCDVCGKPAVEFEEKEDAVSYGIFTYTKAMLMRRSYVIEAEASEGGTITPEGDTTVPYMGAASYTIEPEEGYKIASITVDGKPVRISGTYSFKNVTTNHTIEVVFAEK